MNVLVIGRGSAGTRHAKTIQQLGHTVTTWEPGDACSWSALLKQNTFHAAVVASPPSSHATQAIECLSHSLPVYVEKPAAITTEDLKRMQQTAHEVGQPVIVGYQMRAHRQIYALHHRLRQLPPQLQPAMVGVSFGHDIHQWKSMRNGVPYPSRIGVLLEASHEIDYLLWACPHLLVSRRINATIETDAKFGKWECETKVVLESESGCDGTISLNYRQASYTRGWMMQFKPENNLPDQIALLRPDDMEHAYINYMSLFLYIVQDSAGLGDTGTILATIEDSLNVASLIADIREAAIHLDCHDQNAQRGSVYV